MIPFYWNLQEGAEQRAGLVYGVDLRHAVALFLHGPQGSDLPARHGIPGDITHEIAAGRELAELTLAGDGFALHLLRKGAKPGPHTTLRVPAEAVA